MVAGFKSKSAAGFLLELVAGFVGIRNVDRVKYPSLSANDGFEDAMREIIAGELQVLEANNLNTRETGANADGGKAYSGFGNITGKSVNQLITGKSNGQARVAGTARGSDRSPRRKITAPWMCGAARAKEY